jgi:hypothetical protein
MSLPVTSQLTFRRTSKSQWGVRISALVLPMVLVRVDGLPWWFALPLLLLVAAWIVWTIRTPVFALTPSALTYRPMPLRKSTDVLLDHVLGWSGWRGILAFATDPGPISYVPLEELSWRDEARLLLAIEDRLDLGDPQADLLRELRASRDQTSLLLEIESKRNEFLRRPPPTCLDIRDAALS